MCSSTYFATLIFILNQGKIMHDKIEVGEQNEHAVHYVQHIVHVEHDDSALLEPQAIVIEEPHRTFFEQNHINAAELHSRISFIRQSNQFLSFFTQTNEIADSRTQTTEISDVPPELDKRPLSPDTPRQCQK